MNNPLSTTPKRQRWHWVVTSITIILGLLVAWYVVLAIGVYGFRWQGSKTAAVVRVTPVPAAFVNWRPISLASYLDQRAAVEQYTNYLAASTTGVYQPTSSQDTKALTLTTMIKLDELERLAQNAGVTVSNADVEQAYQAQLLQNGNANEVAATIKQLYGWSPEEFRAHVIRPAVLRDKMQAYLSFDDHQNAQAKQQATAVLDIVQAGKEEFTAIAKKYSEDDYGVNGGDLGFVNKGELAQEIDDAAFSLEPNTVSGIIHTKFGFHIIKVIEKKTVDGVDQVHLQQITLLATSVDAFTNEALKSTSVRVLLPQLKWDSQNIRVTTR